jgi:hypothetical protein
VWLSDVAGRLGHPRHRRHRLQVLKFVNSASRVHRGANGCPQFPLARLSKLDARSLSGTDDEAECESAVSEIQLQNAEGRRATPKVPYGTPFFVGDRSPAASYDRRNDC